MAYGSSINTNIIICKSQKETQKNIYAHDLQIW